MKKRKLLILAVTVLLVLALSSSAMAASLVTVSTSGTNLNSITVKVAGLGLFQAQRVGVYTQSNGDIVLSYRTFWLPGLNSLPDTGTVTYDLQEQIHQQIGDLVGIDPSHSYVWIEVNGVKLAAVDPPCMYK